MHVNRILFCAIIELKARIPVTPIYTEANMNYIDLNKYNKGHISGTCSNDTHFEWEDNDFMEYLLGELPKLKSYAANRQTPAKFYELSTLYRSYNFMTTNPSEFLQQISAIANTIYAETPYWSGLNLPLVEDVLHSHKSCLIVGEGGIGKSYFVKCYEQKLSERCIKHLCVYGKFCKDLSQIDFEEIAHIGAEEEFVFVFDAINEISDTAQESLLKELQQLKPLKGIRIVITYRLHTIEESILGGYKELAEMHYDFPGVSFESAVEWLRKMPVEDITEYLDVLYSNNPFLLGKLRHIMEPGWDQALNNVSRFTHIYEQYIKRALSPAIWRQTKKMAMYMYKTSKRTISISEITILLGDCRDFILDMERSGFLTHYTYDGEDHYTFLIESLADYLIARSMWDDLKSKSEDECVLVIKGKIQKMHSIKEMVILLLFDFYSTDYEKIKRILTNTDLIHELDYDLIVKLHFTPERAKEFEKIFSPKRPYELIEFFAGYPNKPFNCTSYLNDYYFKNPSAQTVELSTQLSKKHFLYRLISRLKNALYLTNKCECNEARTKENFYTALWCTSSGNQTVRLLAEKLLFDTLEHSPALISEAIQIFPQIADFYIQDSLIHALSSCQYQKDIADFFSELLSNTEFTLAASIRRMCEYTGAPSCYIGLDKRNLFSEEEQVVSKNFEHLLFAIDLYEKELLPFRFRSAAAFQDSVKFLATNKSEITAFNERLAADFDCVRCGECNGSMVFQRDVERLYSVSISDKLLNGTSMLASMEKTFQAIFSCYGLTLNTADIQKKDAQDFSVSLFRKCASISIDVFYGSMMCNYYSKNFATYNNVTNTIGFEIYNPLEYMDNINIRSPLPVYQPNIEKMGDLVLCRLTFPEKKDRLWWADLDNAKTNLLQLLAPINYQKHEWILLACRVSIRGKSKGCEWHDTYDLFCCTSPDETLNNDGNERYLTIEIDDYTGNLLSYPSTTNRSWLCKRVPSISYGSSVFEDTMFTLPPAAIISALNLKLNLNDMCWEDKNEEAIIICNNNKSSYYRDPIISTVFIRKDAYECISSFLPIKYFAFSERYLDPMGYCDDTAMHFEIKDGEIVKSVLNFDPNRNHVTHSPPLICTKCKFGFCKPLPDGNSFKDFLKDDPEITSLHEKYGSDEL